ncbi:probable G-protein coupled receptor 33 [Hyperolius riggenbachi]|uniref:probable G-protein coupled receptor 33 n=1 Tax=Hyperolius riggenbachi TaxID=752182 RepID=UPI0035A36412
MVSGTEDPPLSAPTITSSVLLLITFTFGLVVNSLYFWVLCRRMRQTVNTTWFLHLILANFFFILLIPFVAVYLIMKPQWVFGLFMCKLVNSFVSVGMYGAVFLLTMISLDRYWLVFHPHWYRIQMNPCKASLICSALWMTSLLLSSPYLVLRQIENKNNLTICTNNYNMSREWTEQQIKWTLFSLRLIVGFIIPLVVITVCYLRIFIKMKRENLPRSTRPYKIICIAILSFFTCWTPYHMWYGMTITPDKFPKKSLESLQVLAISFACINSCLTPILYLFIVENFKNMFRKSVMALIELALHDSTISANRSLEEKREQHSISIVRD